MGQNARRRAVDRSTLRLAGFSAGLIGLAFLVRWLNPSNGPLPGAPYQLHWAVLAVAFAVTEMVAVHTESRGEAHALTFAEIPYVAGLLLATPDNLLVGRLLGGLIVLGVIRRQSLHKLTFNLAMFAAEATIAAAVYRTLIEGRDPVGPGGWPAVFGAMLTAHVVCTFAVTIAITLFSGWPGRAVLRQVAVFGTVAVVANSAAGLAFVATVWEQSYSGVLIVAVVAALYLLYRSYMGLTERHKSLETLHDFTRGAGRLARDPGARARGRGGCSQDPAGRAGGAAAAADPRGRPGHARARVR